MKAIVYEGKGQIVVKDLKRPEIKSGEALLKVKAAAICGTDIRIIHHGHHLIPEGTSRVLGHEVSGVIEQVASKGPHLIPGMSVAVAPNIHCGTCSHCVGGYTYLCENYIAFGIGIDGGFAEYMVLPEKSITHRYTRLERLLVVGGNLQGKYRPFSRRTSRQQITSQQPGQAPADRQTKTGSAILAAG